jgi:hypothetical protein
MVSTLELLLTAGNYLHVVQVLHDTRKEVDLIISA